MRPGHPHPDARRWRLYAAGVVCLLLLIDAGAAFAGTIGFRIDADVSTGRGIAARVTLTHTGDEAASDVQVRVEMPGRKVDSTSTPRVLPGQSVSWDFDLFDEYEPGAHALVIRVRYADANGYPFEVVSTAPATVGNRTAPRVTGSMQIPRLAGQASAKASLRVKKPTSRSGRFEAHLVTPAGMEASPSRLPLTFDDAGTAVAGFTIHNRKMLPGTAVQIYALVQEAGGQAPQTDSIRGMVRIGAALPRLTYETFYQAAAAVLVLLLLLEVVVRWRREA